MSPQYEDKTPGTLPSQLSEQKLKQIQRGTWNTWNVENLKLSQQIGACLLSTQPPPGHLVGNHWRVEIADFDGGSVDARVFRFAWQVRIDTFQSNTNSIFQHFLYAVNLSEFFSQVPQVTADNLEYTPCIFLHTLRTQLAAPYKQRITLQTSLQSSIAVPGHGFLILFASIWLAKMSMSSCFQDSVHHFFPLKRRCGHHHHHPQAIWALKGSYIVPDLIFALPLWGI